MKINIITYFFVICSVLVIILSYIVQTSEIRIKTFNDLKARVLYGD